MYSMLWCSVRVCVRVCVRVRVRLRAIIILYSVDFNCTVLEFHRLLDKGRHVTSHNNTLS